MVKNAVLVSQIERIARFDQILLGSQTFIIIIIIIIIAKPLWTVTSLRCGHGGYRRPSSYEVTFRHQSRSGSTKSFVVDQVSVAI